MNSTTLAPEVAVPDSLVDTSALRVEALSRDASSSVSNSQLAVFAILATMGMLFAGFASAYLVRREGLDWVQQQLPSVLVWNTVILLASSATIEISRSALRQSRSGKAVLWAAVTTILGLAFLGGQFAAWRQLEAEGVYLPSNPYSSFFYMLTAAHGLHLLGGIVALVYLLSRIVRSTSKQTVADIFGSCATYWHFVGGVWVLLYLLLRSY